MSKKSCIQQACKITDAIFKEIFSNFTFKTEKDVEKFILKRFRDHKVKPAYPPIVANNNATIHAKPRDKKLAKGFLVLDFGCKYKGWCSDITRTIFIGKPSKKERQLYNLVLNCQQKTIKKVKPGASCADLDIYSRVLLKEYKRYYVHALGHGVGKKVHTPPTLRPTGQANLKKGDIITIEPGIYIKKGKKEFGIRVEDTLYVGRKAEVLSKTTRKLVCVQ